MRATHSQAEGLLAKIKRTTTAPLATLPHPACVLDACTHRVREVEGLSRQDGVRWARDVAVHGAVGEAAARRRLLLDGHVDGP